MSKETVNGIIKSCIVSRKGGVPMGEIENDYKELVGQGIPYISLGYKSLRDFIHSIDFVNVKTNYLGDSVLFVSDPKVAHIDSLVSKQKTSSNRKVGTANNKRNRKNRYGKSRQGNNKFVPQNRTPPSRSRNRHYENTKKDNYRPENFRRNTKMEYNQSKWYSDRPRDSWKNNRYEERKLNRFNNFNAARTSMQSSSKNSTIQTENSWGPRTISPSSVEENMYNFNSLEEKRYAQESRSWKFQFNFADNENSTVGRRSQGRSQRETYYDNSPKYNFYFHGQRGGGPTNNSNQSWRDQWRYNPYRDNQSGIWWPGLQGPANTQFTWIGGQYSQNYSEIVIEPLLNGDQLIGDDFFLQLAIKNIKAETRKPRAGAAIQCGLCISGQTIDECRQRLEETQFLSGRIAILLGAVDIFRGHSLEKMVSDMKKLLDVCRNKFKLSDITLCTIPPLANYSVRFNLRKLSVLYSFNNWIKLHSNFSPDDSYIHHYNVIDLFSRFTDSNYRTLYNYFQIDARLVSGCPYPHVLWNASGRHTAISMLEKK